MARQLLLITVFFCLVDPCQAQSIFSALHLNDEGNYKTIAPKIIIETNTFYNEKKKVVQKNIKTFDRSGMLLYDERYDEEGKLSARSTFENDTIHRKKLKCETEHWSTSGYNKTYAIYKYDSHYHLTDIVHKNRMGEITETATYVCNEHGHPIELAVFTRSGALLGRELAWYFYDHNSVVIAVYTNEGQMVHADTMKISYKRPFLNSKSESYNNYGDLIKWGSKAIDGTVTYFENEYEYDEAGNCTEQRIYELTPKKSGEYERLIDRVFKKQYIYWSATE